MSSLGGQWRIIRHYLSLANINSEVEKLLQKVKPASPEQWDNLIKKLEKAVKLRLIQDAQVETKLKEATLRATTANETTETLKPSTETSLNKINDKVTQEPMTVGSEAKEITFESFLQGLKLKKDLAFGNISEQSWKSNKPIVTKTSIHSRTAYVISAIVTAESIGSLHKRTEHFIEHLQQYPEARDYAIKEGGVRALLRVQNTLKKNAEVAADEVKGIVQEALALLGYAGPTRGPGPRILAIDGGGIRGIIAIEVLKHLERLTGTKVDQLFDFIVGVSTGAIIASAIGSGTGNLDSANDMYIQVAKKMFGNTSRLSGTSRLVWSHSYYDTEAWEKMLQENLRDCSLSECNRYNTPKLALVSCVVNAGSRLSPFVFRSYSCGYRVRSVFPGTSKSRLWQAVRASAAAPTYFNEYRLHGLLHQDGGIMVNNPTGVGLHEAKLLYGADALKNACVISLGTGRPLNKHLDYELLSRSINGKEAPGTTWKDKFSKILDSATDTEGMHHVINDLLPPGSYYRFNPPLMEECTMDEVNPDKLNNLLTDTHAYIRRNNYKFEQAAAELMRKRSLTQKVVDYVTYKSQLMGVVQSN